MKTLEDHLNQAGEEVRRASSQLLPVRAPEPHPVRNRLIAGVGVAAAIGAVVLPLILVNLPAADQISPTDVGQGEVVLLKDPLAVRGNDSPEPVFDTSNLGVEVPMLESRKSSTETLCTPSATASTSSRLIPTAVTSKNPPTPSATNTDTWFAVTSSWVGV